MIEANSSHTDDRALRIVCALLALPSFGLAAWMLVDPDAFWRLAGVSGSPFVQALYGGAIAGEGFMFARCAQRPPRYLVFFEYMVVYKSIACIAASRVLFDSREQSSLGWMVIAGWGIAGVISAIVILVTRRRRLAR